MHRRHSFLIAAACLAIIASQAAAESCVGDCDSSRSVTVDEIVRGVGIALELNPVAECTALDANADSHVDISEIILAVGNLVDGCPADDARVVRTQSGLVRGLASNGVRSFLGIPYAAPPVGGLRWHDPEPPAEWSGTRSATQAGAVCPQTVPVINSEAGVEDCLFLNVHTPNPAPTTPLPVMVWIHGGGFTSGDGLQFGGTDGSDIVRKGGVVVVSFNYRLGALGFLAQRQLSQRNAHRDAAGHYHDASGNYGLLDQVAALQWVQRNISAFGGDPHNVTLFGESAGGFSVCFHLTSPLSAGLFQKAISESGVCSPTSASLGGAEAQGDRFATALGCDPNQSPSGLDVVDCMNGKTVDEIRHALPPDPNFAFTPGDWGRWSPIIDDYVVPGQVPDLIAAGSFNRVPVLLGSNKDEGTLFVALAHDVAGTPLTADLYPQRLRYFISDPAVVDAALREYPLSNYATPGAALAAAFGDAFLGCTSIDLARQLTPFVPTYLYQFNYAGASFPLPIPVPLGAFHSAEIQFVFGRQASGPLAPADRPLSNAVMGYWTRFAKTGDPNLDGTIPWPLHGAAANYLAIDTQIMAAQNAKAQQCGFWRSVDYFTPELVDPWAPKRQSLAEARAKWAATGIANYTMSYQSSCFCPGPQAVAITVRGGAIVAVHDVATGAAVPLALQSQYSSVTELFATIESLIQRRAALLDVTYDPVLGYPARLLVDQDKQSVDDEFGVTISALQADR